ncbi:SusC/RagA family TonB-linked outer membrane protein [Pedobacter nutrimenti]|uniref:SusC/RagA family TonB-linked outer membrane protein n=1 Tax=Pedobacter nutrimenti TaxID=1241337 RepID=UPI002931E76C|nr:SusC/RagA family TonB-linked outer membrane protein [Pedobacter nutrimenti]
MKFNALIKREKFVCTTNKILLYVNLILRQIKEADKRKYIMRINLTIILMTSFLLQVSAAGYAQIISLDKTNAPLQEVIKEIRKQTGYDFVYTTPQMKGSKPVTIQMVRASLSTVLKACFENQPFTYSIEDKSIIIKNKPVETFTRNQMDLVGLILDENGKPIAGASIRIKGLSSKAIASNSEGKFKISIEPGKDILMVSYVGYKTQEIKVKPNQTSLEIRMEVLETAMKDVVITGMTVRKKESFTGATASFTGDQLKMLGNQNIVQSLKTVDPSFVQIVNNTFGSNPNTLPTIELRGQTSISTAALRDKFSTDPNQPLFILDGFETSLRVIVDLDMNTIASVTILKDAASTAIYGSRASNGVVVVETKKPLPGKIRLSYTADLAVEMPDLSSYNMMNASEKLTFEKLAGRYTGKADFAENQLALDSIYNSRLKEVLKGVNTYWLNKPLQTGFSHRHSVAASGGSNEIRYDIGMNIRQNNAAMKGSKRDDWGANLNLTYRSGILNIGNRIYISGSQSAESPYGSFDNWVNTNPYYRVLGPDQMYLESTPSLNVPNPYYNASLASFNTTSSFNVQNNFQLSADFTPSFRLQAGAQIIKNSTEGKVFISPLDTQYAEETDPALRGSFTNQKNGQVSYTVNAGITYAKVFGKLHAVTSLLRGEISQNNSTLNGYQAIGFPNASNGNPAFAYGFPSGSTPSAANLLTRRTSLVGSVNYSYDQRYNMDVNFNLDGSTAFGSNRRFAPYYAIGLSWNLHKEHFLKDVSWINSLRLRGNYGLTGNQNFGNVSQSVYNYNAAINSLGQGVYLSALGAPDLEWQSTKQTSVGIDAALLNNRLNIQFNAYQKVTDPLVVAITLPTSTGLSNYPFNAGTSTVKGIESIVSFSPIYEPGTVVWTLGATGAMLNQKYDHFDNKLSGLNNELRNSNALTRYRDGYSAYDLWAVPSLGIDPATGREVFLKKNGQQTFTYDPNDQVVVGSSRPKAEGVFNTTLFYKGFNAGLYVRYVFGRKAFNDALYQKVENISYTGLSQNQDKRALYDRWKNPGDVTEFKAISATETTPISSRFIQDETSFSGESVNLGYEFKNRKWLDNACLSALSINAYSNDFFYASTVKAERGTAYPFARSISMSIRATFK